MVEDGDYAPFHVTRSGTASARIEFKAVGSGARILGYETYDERYTAVTVLGDYVTIDGFAIDVMAADASVPSRGIRVSGTASDYRRGVIVRSNRVSNAGWVGITTSFAAGVVIEYNEVSNSKGQHGIYVANSADDPVIRGNRVHDNDEAGIQINADASQGGDGVITNALIENNVLYGNGRNGSGAIELDGAAYATIRNNLLYGNNTTGINMYRVDASAGSHHNRITHNTIVMPAGSRHGIAFRSGSTHGYLRNNIAIHLGTADSMAVDGNSITGMDSDYNILTRIENPSGDLISLAEWRTQYGQDRSSFVATAGELFLAPASNDYRLAAGSRAIDSGTAVPDLSYDLAGNGRPQGNGYDIGCYEFATPSSNKIPGPPYNLKLE
ncbi:right-handed parallel beta-helix repeat-containing protein [Candidatus Poribacteria bacterium]|nr:right-handed parallel beta-helix repeat-containing protein [Candidatus Poribacteria bacterium]